MAFQGRGSRSWRASHAGFTARLSRGSGLLEARIVVRGVYCLNSGLATRLTPSRRVHQGSSDGHSWMKEIDWSSSARATRIYSLV